ncbi:MAG TPA: helix-turn-helix transcriptional regulator [Thermoanaerobaculia bacterium]|nr:helix-turn-helix transcriptional regulator [Thermoanaerobaculia bacterium]
MEQEVTNAFRNLGKALVLLRELAGVSQLEVAKRAQIGKNQLAKYEAGKELPKLESLEKVLEALELSYWDFFYSLALIDEREAARDRRDLTSRLAPAGFGAPDSACRKIPDDLLALYRAWTLQSLRVAGSGEEANL